MIILFPPVSVTVLNDKSGLEQQREDHNYLDDPISLHEIETSWSSPWSWQNTKLNAHEQNWLSQVYNTWQTVYSYPHQWTDAFQKIGARV